jgi:NDP-sugar pyrophosphorylase family protein
LTPRRAGIIAAGRGDRLRNGSAVLKPLVRVGGRTLIERVLDSMADAAASEVTIIINEESHAVRDHVSSGRWPFALRWIVETTPSSMHSFLRIVETLAAEGDEGPFLVSTVDTVAPRGAYAAFVTDAMHLGEPTMALALVRAVEDEKPLFVKLQGSRVVAIGEEAGTTGYATAGYYAVRSSVLDEAEAARRDGLCALRAFLARLVERGHNIVGVKVPESIDVDRPRDIALAERFLRRVSP